MFTKITLIWVGLALLFSVTGCNFAALPLDTETQTQPQDKSNQPGGDDGEVSTTVVSDEQAPQPTLITPPMQVIFEDMTVVQLLSEKDGYAETACMGDGLINVKPLADAPMVLIPNAGDLSAGGHNVAVRLEPNGTLTFIPRVPGQRIMMTMDVGDKKAGQEVDRLTLDEAMQLMAADQLIWTARDQGPYGNGRAIEGHIAACDPILAGGQVDIIPTLAVIQRHLAETPAVNVPALNFETPETATLFDRMPLVQLLSEESGWAETACAGVGLKNITPIPGKTITLIPNAGDLSADGHNVAIQLKADGRITFVPRVPGQRIMMTTDVGDKKAGQEVDSLTFQEGMQLMAAGKLIWTAKDGGPNRDGLGISGHIATCDPIIAGNVTAMPELTVVKLDASQLTEIAVPQPAEETADISVLLNEMTLVQLLSEKFGWAETACAGNGLRNAKFVADSPVILIPNAGDLTVEGSNVAIEIQPDGQLFFVPRTTGQLIRLPVALGDKAANQEIERLTFAEGMQLMAAGNLTWTAREQGPFGTGHGLPGHIAICDPQYQ